MEPFSELGHENKEVHNNDDVLSLLAVVGTDSSYKNCAERAESTITTGGNPVDAVLGLLESRTRVRNGDRITANGAGWQYVGVGNYGLERLGLDRDVSFRITTNNANELILTDISGVAVQPQGVPFNAPWPRIQRIRVTPQEAQVTGTLGITITFPITPESYAAFRRRVNGL